MLMTKINNSILNLFSKYIFISSYPGLKFKILMMYPHYYHYLRIVSSLYNPIQPILKVAHILRPYTNPYNKILWRSCRINHVGNQLMVVLIQHQYFETCALNHNWNLYDRYQRYRPIVRASKHTNCPNKNHKQQLRDQLNKWYIPRVW